MALGYVFEPEDVRHLVNAARCLGVFAAARTFIEATRTRGSLLIYWTMTFCVVLSGLPCAAANARHHRPLLLVGLWKSRWDS